jgi:hypothetical protein
MSVDASRVDGMTLVNIEPTKPSQLDTIYRDSANAKWRIIGELLEPDFRGKACQAIQNGFSDWLKASARVLDAKKMTTSALRSNLIDVRPFIEMEVENPVNNHYWSFTSGAATGAGETTPNSQSAFEWKGIVASQKGIPADIRWFGPRNTVTIVGKDAGTGGKVSTSYKVVDSAIVNGSLVIYLNNLSANAADPLYLYDGTHYKRANVVRGVLMRGLPNVTTGEAYCDNIPGLNTLGFKPFWIQQTRRNIKEDSDYEKYVEMIRTNNDLFRQFGDVDSVKYAKQVQTDYDNRKCNTFLYNGALANQTTELYPNLELVPFFVGDANSATRSFTGRYQCRRANALGFMEQLAECTDDDGLPALVDKLGTKLKLTEIARKAYLMQQVRIARGMDGKVIELWCHSQFRQKLINAYITYFKTKSDSTLNIVMDATQKNPLGFDWMDVKLDWPNVTLRLVSHYTMDHFMDAAKKAALDAGDNDATATTYSAIASLAFCPDWSATYLGILDAGSTVLETGSPQEIARVDASALCGPLVQPTQRVKHYWETFTTVVECGTSQCAWENFDPTGVDQS